MTRNYTNYIILLCLCWSEVTIIWYKVSATYYIRSTMQNYCPNGPTQSCATVCKTVHPILSDRCLSLSVCDIGVLWPNGWMDQDATWYRARPLPRLHCVRWGPSCPLKGAQPPILAHVYCGQRVAHVSYCWALLPQAGWTLRPDCAPVPNAPELRSLHAAAPPIQSEYPAECRAVAAVPMPESP